MDFLSLKSLCVPYRWNCGIPDTDPEQHYPCFNRKRAFWEDRYHATAVKIGKHLIRCLAYIDLNMVRVGIVRYPWKHGGYNEIQSPKQRYSLINRQKLTALLGIKDNDQLSEYHRKWVEEILKNGSNQRDAKWTESIAVGDKEFVMETKY